MSTTSYQNYILYRTADMIIQPASYKDSTGATVTPSPIVAQAAGYVVGTQLLSGLAGIIVPAGFAYALDAAKAFPYGSIYKPATDYAISCPSTATAGTAVNISLTPNNDGPTEDTVVTLSDGGAGGVFSPETVTFSGSVSTAQTATYTPKAAGSVVISATNSGGLTNPANVDVTVSAAATA